MESRQEGKNAIKEANYSVFQKEKWELIAPYLGIN